MSIIQTLSKHSFRLALDREVADSLLRKDIAETVKPVELIRTTNVSCANVATTSGNQEGSDQGTSVEINAKVDQTMPRRSSDDEIDDLKARLHGANARLISRDNKICDLKAMLATKDHEIDSLKATLLNNDHLVGGDSISTIVRLSTMLTAVLVLALALLFRTLYH
jgi:hypothetical protein